MGLKDLLDAREGLLARHPELIDAEVRRLEREHKGRFVSVGDIIEGYEIAYPFAEGGFGKLNHAMNLETGDIVVIKYPLPSLYFLNEEMMNAIFEKEATLLQLLRHPNVVEAYEHFSHNGIPYIPMECMDMMLADYVSHNPDVETVYSFMRQGMEALKHMHGHRIAHCDVKPNNFMVNFDGTVKITDLGNAKCIGEEISSLDVCTPSYFPKTLPKNEAGANIVHPSIDFYGLGRSAGVLLLGIGGTSGDEIKYVQKSAGDDELTFRLRQQRTPEYLVGIIETCLNATKDTRITAKRIDEMLSTFAWVNYPETIDVHKELYSGKVSRIARA